MKRHPIQPLVTTDSGVVRFKANTIVQYLLENGGITMNNLAVMSFPREDREQFAQLIGYSHSGAGDLSYMSSEVLDAAKEMEANESVSELEARNKILREYIEDIKGEFRQGFERLYADES